MNDKAADAGRDSGEVDLRCEARSLAEHHVAVARTGAGVAGAIAALCPDDDVVEAVAVDVAGRGYRPPHLIELLLAMNDEAADSGGHIRKIDRHVLRSVSLAGRSPLMPAPTAGVTEVAAGLREQAGTRVKAARDRLLPSSFE